MPPIAAVPDEELAPFGTDSLADVLAQDDPEEQAPEETDAEPVTEDEDESEDADAEEQPDDAETDAGLSEHVESDAEPAAFEDESKRGLRRAVIRTVDRYLAADTEEERQRILDRASGDERQQLKWLAERQAQRQSAQTAPADDAAQWTPFEEMERLAQDDPYTFGEKVRPGGEHARSYAAWLSFLGDLREKGLPIGDAPSVASVRQVVRQHNALVEQRERQERERTFDPDHAYNAFASSDAWKHLTAEERDSADPMHFEGDAATRRLQMERHLGRLEERATLRAKRDLAAQKVEQANGTATRARQLASNSPPKVEGGRAENLTDDELIARYNEEPKRYEAQMKALWKRRGWD